MWTEVNGTYLYDGSAYLVFLIYSVYYALSLIITACYLWY